MSMTHDEMIAVIQAAKEGKTIQIKGNIYGEWNDASGCRFNFVQCQYRIKPEPLVLWVAFHSDGGLYAVRNTEDGLRALLGNSKALIKKFVEVTE